VAGDVAPGPAQVAAICNWVYGNLRYLPGTSDSSTSALETARDRTGVCRDFAHLAITLCRALGIPARYVTGYAWGLVMPDFHACMEAFLAGHWHLFDPSRKVATDRMIRIGTGRDAADASFATIFGDGRPSELSEMAVFAEPAPIDPPATAPGLRGWSPERAASSSGNPLHQTALGSRCTTGCRSVCAGPFPRRRMRIEYGKQQALAQRGSHKIPRGVGDEISSDYRHHHGRGPIHRFGFAG